MAAAEAPAAAADGPAAPAGGAAAGAPLRLVPLPVRIGTALNASPFSVKAMAFLRMAGIEHEVVRGGVASNRNPRKLWPYLMHGDEVIPDSAQICAYLSRAYPEAAGRLFPSDPKQSALARAAARLADEALFPVLLWYRFEHPANRAYTEESYFGRLPWLARALVSRSVFGRMTQRLNLQGISKQPESELRAAMRADFVALSVLLGDGPFLLGESPCYADASLFGVLDTALHDGVPNGDVREAIMEHPNLVEFAARVRARYFPERPAGAPAAAGEAAAEGAAAGGGKGPLGAATATTVVAATAVA